MARESAFGAEPEQLRELLSFGLEDSSEQAAALTASLGAVLERPGGQIDGYKLLSILGEGAMGIVYLAEQEHPIKRRVALKVIKPGMDSARVIGRFEAERQALALLDHPYIAHVYDAGTTGAGRPYFVMEYVQGLPITEYCDKHRLTIEQRLSLFQQVCEAVQHAHQKGIIHRDLKPSNILVAADADKAASKIIDFGVAKAIGQPLTEQTLFTEDSRLLGTPEYMSPEQADMAAQDIDTRSDVYSLGAVLYELLTGTLPFDSATLRSGGVEYIRRVIREEQPKTPSTRLTGLGEQAIRLAQQRCTEVGTLAKRLHKELEWIPLKAMRKDRTRRYRSASELADDIGNYLRGDPLIAGPESSTYRIMKMLRKHRLPFAAAVVTVTSLIVGLVISTAMYFRAEHARAEAQAMSDFLQKNLLSSLNVRDGKGKERTVRSILDAISEDLGAEFQGPPLLETSIRQTLVTAYGVLGLFESAELHAKRAFEIQRTHLGPKNIATLYSCYQLGWVYMLQSRYCEAEPLLTRALEGFKLALAEDQSIRLYCTAFLGWVYSFQGRFSEAEQLFEGALAATRHARGSEHPQAPFLMYSRASTHEMQGRYRDAERLYVAGLKISRQMNGERHDDTLLLMQGLGALYCDLGRYDEAEESLQAALKIRREGWGPEYQETLRTMVVLGWLYCRQGRYAEAEALFAEALGIARRVLHETHITTVDCIHGLASVYLSQGKYDEAELLLNEASEMACRLLGEKNWYTLSVRNTWATLHTVEGRYDDAEHLFRGALEGRQQNLGADHPATLQSVNDFGVLRREQQLCEEAESLLRQALEGRQRELGPDHPACFESMHELGVLYIRQARYEDAEPLLLEAFHGRKAKLGPEHPRTVESLRELVHLYKSWPKPDEAAKWRANLSEMNTAEE